MEDKNLAELKRMITAHGGQAVNLYLIGNRHVNRKHNGKSDFEKAHALGFKGKVWVFDTAGIASSDGHFARLVSNPSDPKGMCEIRVCADPDVRPYKFHASTDDISGLQIVKRTLTPTGHAYASPRIKTMIRCGISATTLPAPLTKGDFKFISI